MVNGFGLSSYVFFGQFITFQPGDTLDFAVGYGANGNANNDSTGVCIGLNEEVVCVPEPAGVSLLAVTGLLALRRRRKPCRSVEN